MAKKKKSRKRGGIVWTLLFLAALGVFAYCIYQLVTIRMEYKTGEDEYRKIAEETVTEPTETTLGEEDAVSVRVADDGEAVWSVTPETDPPEVDWEELRAANPDVIGWLKVEGVPSISYPIVQGDDNDYYLHRTIYGTYNFAGSIFIDYENSADFSDCNTIIYGHNMRNGSMFGLLKMLYEKEQYKDSRYIWIATPNGNYYYEIFSLQKAKVGSETYTLFSAHDETFGDYIDSMCEKSLVDFDTKELNEKDYVITLSTCTSDSSTRFVVQARWLGTY